MDNEGGFYNKGEGSEDQGQGVSSDNLNSSEKSFYNKNVADSAVGKEGLKKEEGKKPSTSTKVGLYALEQISPAGKVVSFLKQHKKGSTAAGGGITGLIIGVVVLFGFIASHELITIEQDLMRYEDKAVSFVEKKAANQVMKRIVCKHVSPTSVLLSSKCSKLNAEEQATGATNEDPLAAAIDNFDLTNPETIASLNDQGISVTQDSSGRINGFVDQSTGKPISFSDLSNPEIAAKFEAALPEFDVGQIETLRPLAIEDVNANFDVYTGASDPVDKTAEDAVMGSETDPALTESLATNESEPNTAGESAATAAQSATDVANGIDGASSLLGSAWSAIAKGKTLYSGVEGMESTAKQIGQVGLINTAIVLVCAVRAAANKASINRIPSITGLLVRHATTLFSVADEMKVGGKMTGKQISGYTSLYNGNPAANPKSSNQTIADSAKPFSESAAWQRISGNPSSIVTNPKAANYTPDINQSSLPVESTGSKILNSLNSITQYTPLPAICAVDHGLSGEIIGFGMGAVQAFLGGITLGAAQVGFASATIAVQTTIKDVIIPLVVKYFTPIALDGLESSVQLLNNSDAGANILFNMYSQRLGGQPLQNSQAVALANEGARAEQIAQSQKPLANRLFAFSNPASLVSKLAISLPTSRMAIIGSLANDIIKSPLLLMHSIGSLIGGPRIMALTQDTNPGQPYDVTQYGFTNSQITKYDPISNEHYLYNTTITYNGQTRSLINLLGNPNNYPNATPDNSTTDVFHCFAETPQAFANALNETSPNPICGTEGNYNNLNVTPVAIGTQQVATSFCDQIGGGNPGCQSYMENLPQLQNIMSRFRQYILDSQVMSFYTDLTNTQ